MQGRNTSVIDGSLAAEMAHLVDQEALFTSSMGGLFPEDLDLGRVRSVLDLACGPGWFGRTDEGACIRVSEPLYEERLRAYLAGRGVERQVWTHIMRPVQEAWQQQCEAVWAFWENLDDWLANRDPGVQVIFQEKRVGTD